MTVCVTNRHPRILLPRQPGQPPDRPLRPDLFNPYIPGLPNPTAKPYSRGSLTSSVLSLWRRVTTFYHVQGTFCVGVRDHPQKFYLSIQSRPLLLHPSTPLCSSSPSRIMPPPLPQPPKERGPPSGPSQQGPSTNKPSSSSSEMEPSRNSPHRTNGASTHPRRQEGRPSIMNVSYGE